MKPQVKADLAMLLVTLFWGSSYLFMQMGLTDLETFNLIGIRFGIAFIIAALFFHKRILRINRKTLLHALILGAILFGVFATVTEGVKTTTASQAGFLVSLTVIFVPLLSILLKNKPETRVFFGAGLAVIGIGLLTLTDHFQISQGDALCIGTAMFYATHIIVTGKLAPQSDAIQLGVYQLGFAALFGLIFSIFTEAPRLPHTPKAWLAVLVLSILCSAIGFVVQTVAQQHTTPTHTGLIFSLEPVFAALFAYMLNGETLTVRGYIGAALVLLSVLIAEIDLRRWIRGEQKVTPLPERNLPL
ncbi:DMT family transporter [Brevibacillus choshinensis]|uniref:DMT family transporter n=1 Tax=Brevibacillus choshinensis TaxID=54911 RepID=UPI002E1EBA24|nr:DMT family transporter [Brevibacillus choshinensis]MED4750001.1 DMT family transporter [Brevibacillus choshinensis]